MRKSAGKRGNVLRPFFRFHNFLFLGSGLIYVRKGIKDGRSVEGVILLLWVIE